MCGGNTIFVIVILRIEEVANWIMRTRLQEIHGDLFKYHSRKCKHLRKTDLPGKPVTGSAVSIEAYQTNLNDKRASQFNGMKQLRRALSHDTEVDHFASSTI